MSKIKDLIIDMQNQFDDTDYQYKDFLKKVCNNCNEKEKEDGENHCKFCMRNYMKGGRAINIHKPLHKSLDLMEQRGLQYDI